MKWLICALLLLMLATPLALAESWVLWVQIRITYQNNDAQMSRGNGKSWQEWRHMDGYTTKSQCLVTMRRLLKVLQEQPGKHVDLDSFHYHVYEPDPQFPKQSSLHRFVQGNFYCLPSGVDPKHLIQQRSVEK